MLERFGEAKPWLQRSLSIADAMGHQLYRGRAHLNLGHVAVHFGRLDEARAHLAAVMNCDGYGNIDADELRVAIEAQEASAGVGPTV
jgi:hypothetical protein